MQMGIRTLPRKKAQSKASGNVEIMLIARQGGKDLQIMLRAMGHSFTIGDGDRVAVPFLHWEILPSTVYMKICLQNGIEVLMHRDEIRGQYSVPT